MDNDYRPAWVEPDYMDDLGYELVSDERGYLKYMNKPGLEATDYGKMGRGKRYVYINTTYCNISIVQENCVFVGVKDDGATRTSFNGVCFTEEDFKTVLKLVR